MLTGKANLMLPTGRSIPLDYRFVSEADASRAGYLICHANEIDPLVLARRLELVCDDGTLVEIVVTHWSEKYLACVGRVVSREACVLS